MTTSDRKAAVHGFDPVVRYLVDQYQIHSTPLAVQREMHCISCDRSFIMLKLRMQLPGFTADARELSG